MSTENVVLLIDFPLAAKVEALLNVCRGVLVPDLDADLLLASLDDCDAVAE